MSEADPQTGRAAPGAGAQSSPAGAPGGGAAQQRLFALRGAIQIAENTREAILAGSEELIRELLDRNSLSEAQMVSCLFTVTEDLDAEFPAVAARNLGIQSVPLICSREIPVPGSMPRVVRLMLHYYAEPDHVPAHIYLGAAAELRTDLDAAQ